MADVRPVARRRRSAFAAAFLSLIVPGLGHAYLGRWMRALAWAALPILAIAAGAGIILSAQDRTALKAGGRRLNHNESLRVQRASDRAAVSMRRELVTTSRKDDRLELLVVRAGLRAGGRARGRYDR